jgi:hypothetical protein
MANNVRYVKESEDLRDGARGLVARAMALSKVLVASSPDERGDGPRKHKPAPSTSGRRRSPASVTSASERPARSARSSIDTTEERSAR